MEKYNKTNKKTRKPKKNQATSLSTLKSVNGKLYNQNGKIFFGWIYCDKKEEKDIIKEITGKDIEPYSQKVKMEFENNVNAIYCRNGSIFTFEDHKNFIAQNTQQYRMVCNKKYLQDIDDKNPKLQNLKLFKHNDKYFKVRIDVPFQGWNNHNGNMVYFHEGFPLDTEEKRQAGITKIKNEIISINNNIKSKNNTKESEDLSIDDDFYISDSMLQDMDDIDISRIYMNMSDNDPLLVEDEDNFNTEDVRQEESKDEQKSDLYRPSILYKPGTLPLRTTDYGRGRGNKFASFKKKESDDKKRKHKEDAEKNGNKKKKSKSETKETNEVHSKYQLRTTDGRVF